MILQSSTPEDILSPYADLTADEQPPEQEDPVLADVLSSSHHISGFVEVDKLASLLLKLDRESKDDSSIVAPPSLCCEIVEATNRLHDHDRSLSSKDRFLLKYQKQWGLTLFSRVGGMDSSEARAQQFLGFGKRHAPASRIVESSRLQYLLCCMLHGRYMQLSSPRKMNSDIFSSYSCITLRILQNPSLAELNLPLPNINPLSVSSFLTSLKKKKNELATVQPSLQYKASVTVERDEETPHLPTS